MKNWKVQLLLYHESYNGHDLCDGWVTYHLQAANAKSALKKAMKNISGPQWVRNSCVFEEK